MLNPWLLLSAVLAGLALGGAGYFKGRSDANAACETRVVTMVEQARLAREAEATAAFKKAEKLEVDDAKAKVVYKTITQTVDRLVDRPVYRSVCLDADGLRVANEALSGAPLPTPKLDPPMPGLNPLRGRTWRDSAAKDSGNFWPIPGMPAATSGTQ